MVRNKGSRVAGYGRGRVTLRSAGQPPPRKPTSFAWAELFAWLATTMVAGALLALLAAHNLVMALPVLLGYALCCWVIWQIARRRKGEPD